MQRVITTTLMLVAMVVASFLATAQPLVDEEEREPAIQVDDQVTDGQTITISRVQFADDGWVAIHADEGGEPGGEAIGQSDELGGDELHVGVDVQVQLDASADETVRLHAVLMSDDENATGDEAGGQANVSMAFTVHVSDAQAVVAAGPQELDDEGEIAVPGTNETEEEVEIEVDLARLNVSGFLVIHLDNGGAPGAVVGNSGLLDAGEHRDTSIQMNRSDLPEDETNFFVWVMLHLDDGDGEYQFPGPDGPITVDGTPVMTPVPVAWEDGFFDGLFGDEGGDDRNETGDDGDDVAGEQPDDEGDEGAPAPAFALIALAILAVVGFARRRQKA